MIVYDFNKSWLRIGSLWKCIPFKQVYVLRWSAIFGQTTLNMGELLLNLSSLSLCRCVFLWRFCYFVFAFLWSSCGNKCASQVLKKWKEKRCPLSAVYTSGLSAQLQAHRKTQKVWGWRFDPTTTSITFPPQTPPSWLTSLYGPVPPAAMVNKSLPDPALQKQPAPVPAQANSIMNNN